MEFSRRDFLRALAVGASAALAGCTPQVLKETVVVEKEVTVVVEKEVPLEAPPQVIKLVVDTRSNEVEFMTASFEWFKDKFPNTEAEIRGYAGGEFFTKILALSAAGKEGDVIWGNISGGQYLNYGLKGIIKQLDALVEADGFDLGQFFPATVETCRYETRLYALPLAGMPSNRPLFYNPELLQDVAYDPTTSWDWTIEELIEVGQKLTVREGDETKIWGYAPDTGYWGLVPWLRTFGGDLLSDDGRQCLINSPEANECIKFLWDVPNTYKTGPAPDQVQDTVRNMWLGGNIAIIHFSTGGLSSLKNSAKFDYAASVMPRHAKHGRSDMIGAHHLGVAMRSANPDLAWELCKHYCSKEVGIYKLSTTSGMPAARADVYNSPEAIAIHPGFPALAEAGKWAKLHTVPWNLRGREVINTLHNNMDLIWLNKVGIEEGLNMLQAEIQKILDKPRP